MNVCMTCGLAVMGNWCCVHGVVSPMRLSSPRERITPLRPVRNYRLQSRNAALVMAALIASGAIRSEDIG